MPEICWEEIVEEILFVFCFARTLALRLISQHTTYSRNKYIIGHFNCSARNKSYLPFFFVRGNFIHDWRYLHFKTYFERQVLEKLFHGSFSNFQNYCLKSVCCELITEKIFLHISFVENVWHGVQTMVLPLINQHTAYWTTAIIHFCILTMKFLQTLMVLLPLKIKPKIKFVSYMKSEIYSTKRVPIWSIR